MPKTNRDVLKRAVAQAYFHYERAMEIIVELKRIFEPVHPELAEALTVTLTASLACQEMLTKFWTEAWVQETIRWESWI
jgi:hypothetical protein